MDPRAANLKPQETFLHSDHVNASILYVDCLQSVGTMTRVLSNKWKIEERLTDLQPQRVFIENTTFANNLNSRHEQVVSYSNKRKNQIRVMIDAAAVNTSCTKSQNIGESAAYVLVISLFVVHCC
jgi:hypothetical protein